MKSSLPAFFPTQLAWSNLKKPILLLPVLFLCLQFNFLSAQNNLSISCPADIVQNNDPGTCGAVVNYPAVVNGNPNFSVNYSKPSGVAFPIGTTTVVVQLLDQNGNAVSTCSFNVTVVDKEAPVISNCPGNISVNNTPATCGAVVSFKVPTVFERCTFQQKTFNYTGAPVTFVVPPGVTSISADVKGAAGGRTYYNASAYSDPGLGGETLTDIRVTPGQLLTIYVGGAGEDGTATSAGAGGFNGGGNGSASLNTNSSIEFAGGGGGGASDIRNGAGLLADRIVIAGGGGGAGFRYAGGSGGDLTGQNGSSLGTPAIGGTQTQGGTGGSYETEFVAQDGSLGIGGSGAATVPGGGGGGGYYGGGGGSFGSGAGGGSYTFAGTSNTYQVQGAQEGNGSVSLTYFQPATLVQTTGLTSGSTFPVGETVNTFTATDAAGNTSRCTFKITVTDNQKPLITAPANISVAADANSCAATNVALGTPVTSDNCGVDKVSNDAPASFPVGTTIVNWTVADVHGNIASATQTVTVTDNQLPALTVPASQTFSAMSGSYNIPDLIAADNCGIASVTYTVSGATTRTGSGTNASGSFNTGNSLITYTVTDIHGNVQTGTTVVTVVQTAPPMVVSVPDVYGVSPGGNANTIYIGYGPSNLYLNAVVSGGRAPYTYSWIKTGTSSPISLYSGVNVSSQGEYIVTVMDANGTTTTFKKQIQIVDIRCGAKNDKVAVCKADKNDKRTSQCVETDKVDDLLQKGGNLGSCEQNSLSAKTGKELTTKSTAQVEETAIATDKLTVVTSSRKVSVFPNPASDRLTVLLNNYKAKKAEIKVISQSGMVVQARTVAFVGATYTAVFEVRHLPSGVYIVKVTSDDGIQTEKVILQH